LLEATASDTSGPVSSGVAEVIFYYQDSGSGPRVRIGSDTAAPYRVHWAFPSCAAEFNSTFKLTADAIDNCGNQTTSRRANVNLTGRACASVPPTSIRRGHTLSSDLAVPEARGQVVVNGTEAFFPAAGTSLIPLAGRVGFQRVEAVLAQAHGRVGTWRFDLLAAGLKPGSLRVLAGEVALVSSDALVFRLKGQAGERVVFSFDLVTDR
jgi:hypothetical protein